RTSGGPSHDLLVLLDRHRVMTTVQLARASGVPERTIRYRIERLYSARPGGRASRGGGSGTGSSGFTRPGWSTAPGRAGRLRPAGPRAGFGPRHWWLRPSGARLVTGTAAAEGEPAGRFGA